MMNIQVEILDQNLNIPFNLADTFSALTLKLLKQLNIEISNEVSALVYLDNKQVYPENTLKELQVKETSQIKITLTKLLELNYKHECFEEFQFKGNYFGNIDSFLWYIHRQITKQNEYCQAKIIVNGKEIERKMLWCNLGENPKFNVLVESTMDFIFNDQRKTLHIDVCWSAKEIIQLVQKEFKIQDVILLKWNDKEISPTQKNISLKHIIRPAIFSIKTPEQIKYSVLDQKGQLQEVQINKNDAISELESKIAEVLQLALNSRVQLVFDQQIDYKKTIKQYMIPYNTILDYKIIDQGEYRLKLKNQANEQVLNFPVNQTIQIKDLDNLISPNEKQEIIYFLNDQQLIDTTLPLDKIGLNRADVLVYQIKDLKANQQVKDYKAYIVRQIQITFQNKVTKQQDSFSLAVTDLISEKFELIIKNEYYKKYTEYKMTYNGQELNMNQTFEQARIASEGVLIYMTLRRRIRVRFLGQEKQVERLQDMLLGDFEAQFRIQNQEIPKNYTVFHGRLLDFSERPVEDLNEGELVEFKERQNQPPQQQEKKVQSIIKAPPPIIAPEKQSAIPKQAIQQDMPQKILLQEEIPKQNKQEIPQQVKAPQQNFHSQIKVPQDVKIPQQQVKDQKEVVIPQQAQEVIPEKMSKAKIRILPPGQKMEMLKFKVFISNLDFSLEQEIPANNCVKGLCECVRAKLVLPINSRIKLFLGNDVLNDNAALNTIMDGQNFEFLTANILDYIEIFFENIKTKEKRKQKVTLDDTLLSTATVLNIAQATFFYNNQQLSNLKIVYKELLILHGETISYELQAPPQQKIVEPENNDDNNNLYMPPDSDEDEVPAAPEKFVQEPPQQIPPKPEIAQDLKVYVQVGGKTLKYLLDPKITIKELTESVQSSIAPNRSQKITNQYCLTFQGQKLSPDQQICSLSNNFEIPINLTLTQS